MIPSNPKCCAQARQARREYRAEVDMMAKKKVRRRAPQTKMCVNGEFAEDRDEQRT